MGNVTLPEIQPPIRVVAADSTRMNTQLLVEVLTQDRRFQVVEAEASTKAILEAVRSENADVVLLSSTLEDDPSLGLQLARQIRMANPKSAIVMLLDSSERIAVVEAFRAGARGVFCRTESLKSLAKCIACVHTGHVWANSRELGHLLEAVAEARPIRLADTAALSILSKRELDVVRCVADGLSNREIAQTLNLAEHTVKNYLFRIFDKLGVSSRVEVVLYAFSLGTSPASEGATQDASTRLLPNRQGRKSR
jgi:two-component system nitrate/nitrite response regulator NarL